jgi:hypothetical protein
VLEHPELQRAFNQFHHNVRHSFVPPNIFIHRLGPQDGCPGVAQRCRRRADGHALLRTTSRIERAAPVMRAALFGTLD